MNEFVANLRNLEGTGSVANGSVRATVRTTSGTTVEISEKARREHDEVSLADAVADAALEAQRDYTNALKKALATVDPPGQEAPVPDDDDASAWKRAYRQTLRELEVEAASPRDYVRVGMYGDGEIAVWIRPGTLQRLDFGLDALAAELNAALNSAKQRLNKNVRNAHQNAMSTKPPRKEFQQ